MPHSWLKLSSKFLLLSGICMLVLSKKDVYDWGQYFKVHFESLTKQFTACSACFIYGITGILPFVAILHLRMLTLLGQICRLNAGNNILAMQARTVFSSTSPSCKSWFWQLRDICLLYNLPHPIEFLEQKLSKTVFKKLTKLSVITYYTDKFKDDASSLRSLKYFKFDKIGLGGVHPIFSTCGSNSYEVEKAVWQSRLLSGMYKFERRQRHYRDTTNPNGYCSLKLCQVEDYRHYGDIESFFLSCPSLSKARQEFDIFFNNYLVSYPDLVALILECVEADPVQFFLDASTMSQVISQVQVKGTMILDIIFKLTRTYCYNLHKLRTDLIVAELE